MMVQQTQPNLLELSEPQELPEMLAQPVPKSQLATPEPRIRLELPKQPGLRMM